MLSLAATKSKKPRLQILSRFQSLTHLYLEGQQQGIEILYELKKLWDEEAIAVRFRRPWSDLALDMGIILEETVARYSRAKR